MSGVPTDNEPEQLTGKAATQDRILEAATQLFLERGFEKTTVAQVAEAASVSRATVFWHFSDKRGLFREAFNRLVDPFRTSVERDMGEIPPAKRLHEQIALYDDFVNAHSRAVDGFVRWAVGEPDFRETVITTLLDLHQRYAGALTQTISELVPREVQPEPLAVALITLLDGNMLLSLFDPSPQRAETRQTAIDAFAALIPRRPEQRG
jgi:AcrR family transcriptional regulator